MTAMLKGYHTTSKGYSNDIKVLVLAAGLFMACICLSVCLSVSLSLTHTHTQACGQDGITLLEEGEVTVSGGWDTGWGETEMKEKDEKRGRGGEEGGDC